LTETPNKPITSVSKPEAWLYQHASSPEHIELGLSRCHQVLDRLNLRKPTYKIITVAGTNGKGSTVGFLDAMLSAEGYKTGRYTSPHLIKFNERIVIDGHACSDEQIVAAFEKIQLAAAEIHLTYFEYATLAALVMFSQEQVDVAVLEVGLGGRLDATNSVDADVAIVTSIALDHQSWLGNTLNQVAREKAGIMRPEKYVILAEENMPSALQDVANEKQAKILQLGKDYHLTNYKNNDDFIWSSDSHRFAVQESGQLLSDFQQRNLGAAITALWAANFTVSTDAISQAIDHGIPAGRLQTIEYNGKQWLLDVAHNPASMQVLCERLHRMRESNDEQKFSVIFSMLSDKEFEVCTNLLKEHIEHWFIAPVDSPRSMSSKQLLELMDSSDIAEQAFTLCTTLANACFAAAKHSENQLPLLVCGSFYTVSEAMQFLQKSGEVI